jgi:hypothetical protein
MNVEIGTEAAKFPDKDYINGIFVAVNYTVRLLYVLHISPLKCCLVFYSLYIKKQLLANKFKNIKFKRYWMWFLFVASQDTIVLLHFYSKESFHFLLPSYCMYMCRHCTVIVKKNHLFGIVIIETGEVAFSHGCLQGVHAAGGPLRLPWYWSIGELYWKSWTPT